MPAKDIYHDTVKRVLEKDGWTITDQFEIEYGDVLLRADLGAEKVFAAGFRFFTNCITPPDNIAITGRC